MVSGALRQPLKKKNYKFIHKHEFVFLFSSNILEEDSSNEISRWFTDSMDPDQYLILKLESPAIVETITFGKYMKAHVSDLKSFKILGGMEENNLTLLLKE